jgi:ABC-2 type transport system permease protein
MSTTTRAVPPSLQGAHGVTFPGVLHSEWVKLRSLRSTFWCSVVILVLSLALTTLLALVLPLQDLPTTMPFQAYAVQTVTSSTGFTALVAAVLGALVITGEFGTGMIRSTFAAVPARLPALFAKAIVVTVTVFVVAGVSVVLSLLLGAAIFGARGETLDLGDGAAWLSVLGDAGYLALVTTLALTIGALIRNSAGGIAVALGLILVVPTIVNLIAGLTRAVWAANLGEFLPSNAGTRMYGYHAADAPTTPLADGQLVLEPWQGLLVLLAWIVVLGVLASVLLKRRDA